MPKIMKPISIRAMQAIVFVVAIATVAPVEAQTRLPNPTST